jgi:hypothetical protein
MDVGVEVYLRQFLTSVLDGCDLLASRLGQFISEEIVPSEHSIGGRAGLDAVEKSKSLALPRIELRPSSP